MTNLPPFPASRGPATATKLRAELERIDRLIATQLEAVETLDAAVSVAFERHDETSTTQQRLRDLAHPPRKKGPLL